MYDLAADQRRKIANQRNIQELAQKGEDIERLCVVLGGILATIRVGNHETLDALTTTIRNTPGLPDLSFYVNGLMAAWPEIYLEFQNIDFYLDDAPRRPSVEMMEVRDSLSTSAVTETIPEENGMMDDEEFDHAARRQRAQMDGPGAQQSVKELDPATGHMNTREQSGPKVNTGGDGHADFTQHRRSESASDNGSARSSRGARPWEIP